MFADRKQALNMLPGVSLSHYLCFTTTAFICAGIGSQIVHKHYNPLSDLDKYIEVELKKLSPETQEKVKKKLIERKIIE